MLMLMHNAMCRVVLEKWIIAGKAAEGINNGIYLMAISLCFGRRIILILFYMKNAVLGRFYNLYLNKA
jgi:hypothetical protein